MELLSRQPEVSSGEMNRLSINYEYALHDLY